MQSPGAVLKYCPVCKKKIYVNPAVRSGSCQKCGAHYTVHKVLSGSQGKGKAHGIRLSADVKRGRDPFNRVVFKEGLKSDF
jgi:ribosomal protein L44E